MQFSSKIRVLDTIYDSLFDFFLLSTTYFIELTITTLCDIENIISWSLPDERHSGPYSCLIETFSYGNKETFRLKNLLPIFFRMKLIPGFECVTRFQNQLKILDTRALESQFRYLSNLSLLGDPVIRQK